MTQAALSIHSLAIHLSNCNWGSPCVTHTQVHEDEKGSQRAHSPTRGEDNQQAQSQEGLVPNTQNPAEERTEERK